MWDGASTGPSSQLMQRHALDGDRRAASLRTQQHSGRGQHAAN